jgi:hypothetical protein
MSWGWRCCRSPPLVASLPATAVIATLSGRIGYGCLLAAPLAAALFVGCFCLETALLKWGLLGKVAAGRYSVYSGFYVHTWFVDRLLLANFV